MRNDTEHHERVSLETDNPTIIVNDDVEQQAVEWRTPPATVRQNDDQKTKTTKPKNNLVRAMLNIMAFAFFWMVINSLSAFAPEGLPREMFTHLPMQILWTWCLFQLNERMAAHFKNGLPISNALIVVISLSSFVLMPVFAPYHFASRWLDPFFWGWLVSQSLFFFKVGRYLDAVEAPENSFRKLALLLPLCANLYLPFSYFSPPLINAAATFNLCWFICQFLALGYLATSLKQPKKAPAKQDVYPRNIDKETIVRYRDFSAIERWFRQFFFSGSGTKKSNVTRLTAWFVTPLSLLVIAIGMPHFLFQPTLIGGTPPGTTQDYTKILETDSSAKSHNVVRYLKISEEKALEQKKLGDQNLSLMMTILLGLSGATGAALLYFLLRPSFLTMSEKGLRFRWKAGPFQKNGSYVQWKELTYINLVGSQDNSANASLHFQLQNGKQFKLKLNAIETGQEKEAILKSIQAYAPLVERDSKVIECLQPAADHSYTELWLQALTAPPQRERLQPLRAGGTLQDAKYKVVKSIGVGGQGQAYLATNPQQGEVVLKEFILPVYVDVAVRKGALEQFQNEAQLLRHIDHPNIVKLLDFFVEDHRAYLVLEHIDGASLRQIVESRGKLPEATVRELTAQMCSMLSYLHSLIPPIVHRDFTPDNLILNKDGTLKLIDFNVAKQIAEEHTVGTVVGKHAYLPPEQFRGQPVTQSDIYAMGGTLQYLLTGEDPTPVSVSSPITRDASISLALDNVVRKATALNVKDRYQTVDEIEVELK